MSPSVRSAEKISQASPRAFAAALPRRPPKPPPPAYYATDKGATRRVSLPASHPATSVFLPPSPASSCGRTGPVKARPHQASANCRSAPDNSRFPPPSASPPAACVYPCNRHRSEEHTSELQSLRQLVCRLLCLNDPATTEIYTLSLHGALPICRSAPDNSRFPPPSASPPAACVYPCNRHRSEERRVGKECRSRDLAGRRII